ncbi:MAG: hypothetical protein RLZZ165_918 [Bacteroidota bacterium]|jgi:hypothetical protein
MFRPQNADTERDEQAQFLKTALLKHFRGDHQKLLNDFPAFVGHPSVHGLLLRYSQLQDDVYAAFISAGFGSSHPEITPVPVTSQETAAPAPEPHQPHAEEGEKQPEPEAADPDVQAIGEEKDPLAGDGAAGLELDGLHDASSSPAQEEGSEDGDAPMRDEEAPDEALEVQRRLDPPILPVRLNLPNAKIGVEYLQKIDITPLHRRIESIISCESRGFKEIGLDFTYDSELNISGIPSEHGKFPVSILVRFAAEGDRPAQDYRLQGEIDILPDPRKMWKEIEPDDTLPFQKSHLRTDLVHMAGRTMIAASRRGRSHAHSGTFRDDDFELRVKEDTAWYVMAVADGAGSAPYSRRGSQIACEKAVEVLDAKLDEKLSADLEELAGAWNRAPTEQLRGQIRNRIYEALSHAAYAGYRAICAEAEAMGESPKTFHTTLLLSIVRQYDFGYFVGTWWVGDGAAAVLQQGRHLKVLGTPDGGQFAGQTRFLTMPEIWADGATVMKRIEFDVVQDFTAVILMTDGVSDPKFHTDHDLRQQQLWDKLWDDLSETVTFDHDNLDAPDQLLEWLDFWAAGEHDDRTIAVLF